jgi:hypothetical protein
VASNAICEGGISDVCPLAILTGKSTAVCNTGCAFEPVALGKEGVHLSEFTYDLPDHMLLKDNESDQIDTNLLTTVDRASAQPGGGKFYSDGLCVKLDTSTTNTTDEFTCAGWLKSPADGTVITTSGSTAAVWSLAKHTGFLRHLWFGRVRVKWALSVKVESLTSSRVRVNWVATWSDGTTSTVATAWSRGEFTTATYGETTLTGMTTFGFDETTRAKNGLLLTDLQCTIGLTGEPGKNLWFSQLAGDHGNHIELTFLDVPVATKYQYFIISGLTTAHTIAVSEHVQVEAFVKRGTKYASFLPRENIAPFDLQAAMLVQTLSRQGGAISNASSFKGMFRKAWKTVKPFAKLGGKALLRTGLASVPGVGPVLAGVMPSAVSFGEGERVHNSIAFPLFNQNSMCELRNIGRSGQVPDFVGTITNAQLGAGDGYVGNSDGLAFLLAALREEGWAVRNGAFSGEVRNVNYAPNRVAFRLLPIACARDKAIETRCPHEVYLSPSGVMSGDGLSVRSLKRSDLFAGPVSVTIEKVNEPFPYNYHYDVVATRNTA